MEFKTLKRLFKPATVILVFILGSFSVQAEVSLVDGFVRAMPPSVPNTAAYLTLKNSGEPLKLVGVTTNIAKEAQLHTLIEDNGLMKMRQVDAFNIGSHQTLTLSPSADHIMLLGLNRPLKIEQQVKLTLMFDNKQTLVIHLPVLKSQSAEMSHHHH